MTAALCTLALCFAAVTVTDGDTLRAGDLRLRLWGIDAAEAHRPGGPEATAAMLGLVAGHPLACEDLGLDRYGRTVARCFLADGTDLACAMVAAGQARDWPKYSGGAYAGCARD